MATRDKAITKQVRVSTKKRAGVHAKTKNSDSKNSKFYRKKSRGQG